MVYFGAGLAGAVAVHPADCAFVGDSAFDMLAGRVAVPPSRPVTFATCRRQALTGQALIIRLWRGQRRGHTFVATMLPS